MNKLMTTQLGNAQLGRNEDSYLAHVAKGEMVVPPVLSGETQSMVNRDMMLSGLDPMRYTVGTGANSINPMTGQPEFFIGKALKGIGSVASKAIKSVADFAPDFAVNYAMTGGNPYAAAGMTIGNEFGGDLGRTVGSIAGASYNPGTGGFNFPNTSSFNPSAGNIPDSVLNYYSNRGFTSGGPEGVTPSYTPAPSDYYSSRGLTSGGPEGAIPLPEPDSNGNFLTDLGGQISDFLGDTGLGTLAKSAGALEIGNQLLSSLNKPYNPYENYKPPSLQTEFQPVAIRTGLTSTDYVPGTPTSPALLTGQIAPSLQALQAVGTSGAQQLYPAYIQQAMMSRPEDVVLNEDVLGRQQEIYQQGLDVLAPEMMAQQIASRDRSFGTGRLGLNLSGEAMGAGAGAGLVNVDDYTQQLAQNRALSELFLNSRNQAATETGEIAKRELARSQLQEANRVGYLNQLGGVGAESLQMALGLDELERVNMQTAANIYLGNRQIDAKLAGALAPAYAEPTLLQQLGSQAVATAAPALGGKLLDYIF